MTSSKVPELYDQIHGWIDVGVITEAVLSTLWEEGLPLTNRQAQHLWYRALEELPGLLTSKARQCIGARPLIEGQRGSDERERDRVPF